MKTRYLNSDMFKLKSLQNNESRAQSAYYLEVYRRPRAFNGAMLSIVKKQVTH